MTDIATLGIRVDSKSALTADRNLDKLTGASRKTEKATDALARANQRLTSALKMMVIAGAAATIYALQKIARESIAAASALQEVQGKFDVVFRGQQKQAEEWAKTLVSAYAMSRREAKQYLSSVQDLLVPMGMEATAAAKLSNEIVKLSADLGSFNNLPTAQVMLNIQSALTGEYESMKKYGVVINATVVQQKALNMGLASTKDELTAGMKAQAAYALMVEGSTAAIGDMARTQNNYANQLKKFHALVEDTYATIGKFLIPAVTDVVIELNKWLQSNEDLIAQKIPEYFDRIATAANVVRDGVAGVTSTFLALAAGSLTAYAGILNVAKAFAYLRSKVGVGEEYRAKYKAIYEELVIDAQAATDAATALAAKSQEPFLGSLEDTANAATKATKEAAKEIKDIWLSHAKDLQAIRDKELAANAKAAEAAQKATIKSEIDTTDFVKAYNEIEAVKQSAAEMAGKIEKVYGKELADAYIESVVSAYRDGILETERASQAQKDIWSDYNEDYQILLIGEEEFKRQQYIKGLDIYLKIEQDKTDATAEEMAKRRALILEDYDKLAVAGEDVFDKLAQVIQGWGRDSADAITKFALTGEMTFSDMIDSMIQDLIRMMVYQQMTGPLFAGVGSLMGGGTFGTGVAAFQGRATGGPVSSGKMYEVNETRAPELLSVGNRQFLMMAGQSGSVTPAAAASSGKGVSVGGMQMQVTIYNSTGDSVETKQGKTADGSPTLDVMIDQAVAKKLGTFGSKSNKAMRQNFGASQRLTRR